MVTSTNVVYLPERYQDVHLEVDFAGAYRGRYIETICGIGYRFQPFRERPSR